ncbi:hypothetical protein BCF55_1308 [Hydrogenivirga caldilitoris]|uniref:Uncharacterized protein n=1 Tax=Hydrogenivirga caldilitoris TaxID=246264 RepID=A0A497XSE2_9AQUI|nr:hypothetical protein [Hydrogenivirga caldilitoris]RLJ71019.1 hypothetical protein BCF55_1308 [Hydrogenivirga caldilitoris]
MRGKITVLTAALVIGVMPSLGKDPFMNKENAVGYIVIDNQGMPEKYLVLESKDEGVKLIRTEYEPKEVLKQGGKKK